MFILRASTTLANPTVFRYSFIQRFSKTTYQQTPPVHRIYLRKGTAQALKQKEKKANLPSKNAVHQCSACQAKVTSTSIVCDRCQTLRIPESRGADLLKSGRKSPHHEYSLDEFRYMYRKKQRILRQALQDNYPQANKVANELQKLLQEAWTSAQEQVTKRGKVGG